MYGIRPDKIDTWEPNGKEFEGDFIAALKTQFKDNKSYRIQIYTGAKMDREQGTDLTCGELRLDPTLNFSHKNCMPYIYETDIPATPCHNFKMGIRHGNRHDGQYTPFEQAVIVIGVDMASDEYKVWRNDLLDSINEHAEELIMTADDCYLDYITTDKKERQDLFSTPLKDNPDYRVPKELNGQYAEIRRFRIEINAPEMATASNNDIEGDFGI